MRWTLSASAEFSCLLDQLMWKDSGERQKGRLWCARRWLASEAPKSRTGNDRVYGGQTNQAIGNRQFDCRHHRLSLSTHLWRIPCRRRHSHTHLSYDGHRGPSLASKCRSSLRLCSSLALLQSNQFWMCFIATVQWQCLWFALAAVATIPTRDVHGNIAIAQRHDVLLCITYYLFMIASLASSTCPMPVMTRRDYMKLDKKSNCTAIQLLLQLLSIFKRHLFPHWRIRMKQET